MRRNQRYSLVEGAVAGVLVAAAECCLKEWNLPRAHYNILVGEALLGYALLCDAFISFVNKKGVGLESLMGE